MSKNKINPFLIIFIVVFFVWCCSGFYTIKEAERGVVTNFGKFSHLVAPGLNWRPVFINEVQTVNVETVRELATSGIMLTSDENVVRVEMNVQYKITDPSNYLFLFLIQMIVYAKRLIVHCVELLVIQPWIEF